MSDAASFFDRIARRYDRAYALGGEASRGRNEALLALVSGKRRVLDLGVGTGRELSALQHAGHEVVGLEIASEMIALCNKRAHPIPIVQADLWAHPWPVAEKAFDAVIALHGTLAHPPHAEALDRLFANATRALVPSGIVVAELPTPSWLSRAHGAGRLDRLEPESEAARARFTDDVNGAAIEIRLYDEAQWRAAARGFVVELTPLGDDEVRFVARKVG